MLEFFVFIGICAFCIGMFALAEAESSVFPRLGFMDDDISLDDVQLKQYYHFGPGR